MRFEIGTRVKITGSGGPYGDYWADQTGIVHQVESAAYFGDYTHEVTIDGGGGGSVWIRDDHLQKLEDAANNDVVEHPAHYISHPSGVECLDVVKHMNFPLGNVVKYVWRADLKGNAIEDLEKAAFYLKTEIERRKAAND